MRRRRQGRANPFHEREAFAQVAAGSQRALRGPLNHRAVRQRIRKRDADFDDVGAGAVERLQDLC